MNTKKYLTIPEAIELLKIKTGRAWESKNILQVSGVLVAEPHKASPVTIKLFNASNRLLSTEKIPWDIAVLNNQNIEQLINFDQTYVEYAVGHEGLIVTNFPQDNDSNYVQCLQIKKFDSPTLITTKMVRVPLITMEKILNAPISWPIDLLPLTQIFEQESSAHIQKSKVQEKKIIEIIGSLKYDPKALPKIVSGKSGIKKEVLLIALKDKKTFTESSFKKAWDRLRSTGEIKNI